MVPGDEDRALRAKPRQPPRQELTESAGKDVGVGDIVKEGERCYNKGGCLTEAQKEFLTVLARIAVRRFVKEVEKQLEGEML